MTYNKMTSGYSEIYMNDLYVLGWTPQDERAAARMSENNQICYEDMKVFMLTGATPSELRN